MAFEPGSELERAHKLRMVFDQMTKEDDGRVGETTSEKGDQRGGGATVWAALGGAVVGGVGKGVGEGGVGRGVGRGTI